MVFDRRFFSSINFQTLLNISEQTANSLAEQSIQFRDLCIASFDKRLYQLVSDFSAGNNIAIPRAEHHGWQSVSNEIAAIQQQYGSVILALFHFGMHRDIIVDLACNNIPIAAPIAGKSYWDFYQQRHIAPDNFADCFNLIEVDSPSVGKQLVKQMRMGRLITIYADGNMGPDGAHVAEGGTTVNFFSRSIAVKEGVARLARSFKLPVLPLFSQVEPDSPHHYRIVTGELIHTDANIMQQLYHQLESCVTKRPQDWEFITCCHRWISQEISSSALDSPSYTEATMFKLNLQHVRVVQQKNDTFLLNLKQQKAFKLPSWATGMTQLLAEGCTAQKLRQWVGQDNLHQHKHDLINELISKELVATSR